MIATGVMKPYLKRLFNKFDYQEYGGVPLLGIDGVVIIGHGKSSAKAIQNMIIRASEMIANDVNKKIELALVSNNVEKTTE